MNAFKHMCLLQFQQHAQKKIKIEVWCWIGSTVWWHGQTWCPSVHDVFYEAVTSAAGIIQGWIKECRRENSGREITALNCITNHKSLSVFHFTVCCWIFFICICNCGPAGTWLNKHYHTCTGSAHECAANRHITLLLVITFTNICDCQVEPSWRQIFLLHSEKLKYHPGKKGTTAKQKPYPYNYDELY